MINENRKVKPAKKLGAKTKRAAKEQNPAPKEPEPKKPSPADVFVAGLPPRIQDAALNPNAHIPPSGEGMSPSLRTLLYGRDMERLVIVKIVKNGITNKEEFVTQMAAMNFKVIFLEYSLNCSIPPIVERWGEDH